MTISHDQLKTACEEAIDNLNSDTSVSPEQTRDSLWELKDFIEARIAALNDDLRANG